MPGYSYIRKHLSKDYKRQEDNRITHRGNNSAFYSPSPLPGRLLFFIRSRVAARALPPPLVVVSHPVYVFRAPGSCFAPRVLTACPVFLYQLPRICGRGLAEGEEKRGGDPGRTGPVEASYEVRGYFWRSVCPGVREAGD